MLLPKTQCTHGLLRTIEAHPDIAQNCIVGLFVTDPFLNLPRIARDLLDMGVQWVTNLPTISQHEEEFSTLVDDVGFGVKAEMAALTQLAKAGMKIMASASNVSDATDIISTNPDAVFVLPTLRNLSAGFTSLTTRTLRLKSMREALEKHGYTGPVMGLLEREEAEKPKASYAMGGAILRPQVLHVLT